MQLRVPPHLQYQDIVERCNLRLKRGRSYVSAVERSRKVHFYACHWCPTFRSDLPNARRWERSFPPSRLK